MAPGCFPFSSWDTSWLLALLLLGQVLELQASITMVGSVGNLCCGEISVVKLV
jgi:hypothetical protein